MRTGSPINHPFYMGAVRLASRLAKRHPGICFTIFYDGDKLFVRSSKEPRPLRAKYIGVAYSQSGKVVELSFGRATRKPSSTPTTLKEICGEPDTACPEDEDEVNSPG